MRAVRALCAVGLGTALSVSGLTAVSAYAGQSYYVPVTDKVTVLGHGYGHGNGMSQYGAEGGARAGKSYREILARYYPGTSLGTMRGRVRVLISADTTSDVKVSPARGLSVRDRADGSRWVLPTRDAIRRWRILPDGRVQLYNGSRWRRWRVPGRTRLRGDGEFLAREPITLWVPSGNGEVGRRYRGVLRSARPSASSGDRDTVNVLKMDAYVRGVVPAEMPSSWSPAALKAQAVAARTYATRDRDAHRSRYYQTCDTTSCQVYGGVGAEAASSNAAVRATSRQILRYAGEPAFTQFSSSSGGYTGDGGYPYLRPVADPWDDWPGNPNHSWSTTVDAGRAEQRYNLGNLQEIRVTRRNGYGDWNGRVLRMRLVGSRRTVTITGDDFRWLYGLKSTWFKIGDTPIITRWRNIGAARSPVGRPVGVEHGAAGSGATQRFRTGRIYWSRRTGARETYGPILRTYLRRGGAKSRLGFPRTGVRQAGRDGQAAYYQHGRRLYWNPPTGVHEVRHGWLRAYRRAGFVRGLGLPRTDVHRVKRGKRMRFEGGRIIRTRNGRFHIHHAR